MTKGKLLFLTLGLTESLSLWLDNVTWNRRLGVKSSNYQLIAEGRVEGLESIGKKEDRVGSKKRKGHTVINPLPEKDEEVQ